MPEHVKVLVVMNGIRYESEEARQLIENLMERNSVQCERVELLTVTPAAHVAPKKKKGTKRKKKVAADIAEHNEKVAKE